MNTDIVYRIEHALDLILEALRGTANELVTLAPKQHNLERASRIQRRIEEAQTVVDTLESFL